jgi:hypothetical protein
MIETQDSRTRDIPIWLTAVVLLACLGGGGWLIRWYMQDRPRQTVDVTSDVEKRREIQKANGVGGGNGPRSFFGGRGNGNGGGGNGYMSRAQQVDPSLDGVHPHNANTTRVKVGNTVMVASNAANGRIDLAYYKSIRTSEQEQLAMMFLAVRGDSNWREHLGVTDAQREQFTKVPPALPTAISGHAPMKTEIPADRQKLAPLWKAYRDAAAKGSAGSAEKAAAEKALLAGLDEVGKKNLQATKDYEVARADAIRAAFTPEQVKKFLGAASDKAPLKPKAAADPATPASPKLSGKTGTAASAK